MWPLLVTTRIGNDLSWLAVKISVPSPVEYSPATHGTVTVHPHCGLSATTIYISYTNKQTPTNRFITKDADSKWRALRRRGDPGIDIPDSLPRTTRVGSLPRKKGTVPFVHPEPERGLPYGVGPSEPCIKTGARWAGQAEGTSSLVSIYHTQQQYTQTNKQTRLFVWGWSCL